MPDGTASSCDLSTAKERLRAYIHNCDLSELDFIVRRLERLGGAFARPEKEKPMKYMAHKDFHPRLEAKLDELCEVHGPQIFTRAFALKEGTVLDDYLEWYILARAEEISSHAKKKDLEYYKSQARHLARKRRQKQMERRARS